MSPPITIRPPKSSRAPRAKAIRDALAALRDNPVTSVQQAQLAIQMLARSNLLLIALLKEALPGLEGEE